ncbi:alpha-keto acid decarboxylase family protein [Streptomyces griseoluteus]|uniref:alpha-keto acid decarboxylase family protein n=1 Tax=Streptomyces griseoluteus TaxID=29306 RepID=UPI00382E8A39
MSDSTAMTIGDFLIRRLREAGIGDFFGVPGDFNLEFMQQIEDSDDVRWVGTCNELNGAYAADGYARLNGLGVVVVTHGVGALSAVNGVAGAYAEHVPLVCVAGALPLVAEDHGLLLHHTFADGGRDEFRRAYAQVTAGTARLTPQNAVMEIDRLIRTAWQLKRPVYLELPSDIAYLTIPVPNEPLELVTPASDPERLESAARAIVHRLAKAEKPALLLDCDADRYDVAPAVTELSGKLGVPIAVVNTARGVVDGSHPYFTGTYPGAPAARQAVEESDCLLAVGYRSIDSTTGFYADRIPDGTIHLRAYSADVDGENYQAVSLPELLKAVAGSAPSGRTAPPPERPAPSAASDAPASEPLTQAVFWPEIQGFLREGDVVIAEDGTSVAGLGGLILPDRSTFVTQAVWGSIGYTVGSLLGTLVAAPERRHLLFVGDGSFQLTAQEISTMLRHDLKPVILLINNRGYTIERTILGKNAHYNDVADWSYSELPAVLRADGNARAFQVGTLAELREALHADHDGMKFIEIRMDQNDAPPSLVAGGHKSAYLDYGPRGPQSRPDSQI